MLTQNPLYLLVLLAVGAVQRRVLVTGSPEDRGWGSFLRFGLLLAGLTVAFNLLFGGGGETRLFTLPEVVWKVTLAGTELTLVQLGGPVSVEALVFGLTAAGVLLAILLLLATFNGQVDPYQLMRRLPPFLDRSATVASIALAFVPQMVRAQGEIREALALRGRTARRLRDLPPLFVALLSEGLEGSIALAESMEARGFGRRAAHVDPARGRHREIALRAGLATALLALALGAFLRADPAWHTPSLVLLIAGAVLLAACLASISRGVRRSRYRRELWRRRDSLLAGASLLLLGVFTGLWWLRRSLLYYQPYPRISWPPFHLPVAAALLLVAAPAVILWLEGRGAEKGSGRGTA